MEFDFLSPLNPYITGFVRNLTPQHLGSKVVLHTETEFPDLDKVKLAIVGVLDARGAGQYEEVNLDHVRMELYSLFPGNWFASIADLGDIIEGNTVEDTHYAVREVIAALLKKKIIPIVIGGSQDSTYAMYRAYDALEHMVNLVCIDSRFDFGKPDQPVSASCYLSKIVMDEPNNLFNYSNVGYQTYYNSQEEIDLIEKLFFDEFRLGEVTANIAVSEPVFRDADLVSLDLTSVKSCDSGNLVTFTPNGFNGKEICALARYAGISDKVSSFGIFNHNSATAEAPLIAQIVWYFMEGYHYRSNEYPFGSREHYLKYIVPLEEEELVFFKSDVTERWWIEIPHAGSVNNKLKRNTLLPCSHEDYLSAVKGDIPKRWWKAQRKSLL